LGFSYEQPLDYYSAGPTAGTIGLKATEGLQEKRMKGLIAAAGLSARLQDLGDRQNKTLLDLGGDTLLGNILNHFQQAGIHDIYVMVGFDALAVRTYCHQRACCILNPFFEHYGILGSIWLARPLLAGLPFLFTTADHFFGLPRLQAFLQDQPKADVLVDVELKPCDDEDMKIYVNRQGALQTITKTVLKGTVLGEFTGTVRFSAEGSRQFFDIMERYVWQQGIQGYLADVLCSYHRRHELSFHLSSDHQRVEVDFPCDLAKARSLYQEMESRPMKIAN
jgi:choline kinase